MSYGSQQTNAAQFNAQTLIAFADVTGAENVGALPHNMFLVSNTNTTATVFGFLDNAVDLTAPDFVVPPGTTVASEISDNYAFTTIFLYNSHATTNIAAEELKITLRTL